MAVGRLVMYGGTVGQVVGLVPSVAPHFVVGVVVELGMGFPFVREGPPGDECGGGACSCGGACGCWWRC